MDDIAFPISREWTPDEDKILNDMLQRGCSHGQIALELHRTRNSCISRARRLCLEVPPRDNRRAPKPKKSKPLRQGPIATTRIAPFVAPVALLTAPPAPEQEAPAPVAIPETELAPDAQLKPFDELNYFDCRYPHGDSNFIFCGAPREIGPYCAFHHRLTHSKTWR